MISITGEFNRDDFSEADLARLDLIGDATKWMTETFVDNMAAMVIAGRLLSIAKEIIEAKE